MELTVRDVSAGAIDDVFRVCSPGKPLDHPVFGLKRRWMERILAERGSVTKVAYLGGKPVAQALFLPEEAIPYLPRPRRGVVQLRCVYNPFPEARGKGAATSLVRSLIGDCGGTLPALRGEECRFISAEAFNTGEGVSLADLYHGLGFRDGVGELYYPIHGGYEPPEPAKYQPEPRDSGVAYIIYSPTCEYAPVFAERTKEAVNEAEPTVRPVLVNQWEDPSESIRLGNHWLTVNGVQIQGSWAEKERLREDIRVAATRLR